MILHSDRNDQNNYPEIATGVALCNDWRPILAKVELENLI